LPYSSCEGHGITFRRYVGLAFADQESRQYVADFILNLKIPGVKVNFLDSICNQKIEPNLTNSTSIKYVEKYDAKKANQKEKEIHSFNIQFHRRYNDYFFLEIVILDSINYNGNFLKSDFFKKPFKTIWLYFMKKYKWDKLTQRLVDALNSNEFKKYKF